MHHEMRADQETQVALETPADPETQSETEMSPETESVSETEMARLRTVVACPQTTAVNC
jgi:hypothetical protein